MNGQKLHPGGAVCAAYGGLRDDIFRQLAPGAQRCDLSPYELYLAEELVNMYPFISGGMAQRTGLAVATLAVMIAERQGSTCLPLDEVAVLREVLRDVVAAMEIEISVNDVIKTIRYLGEGLIGGLIGMRDARQPLVVDRGALYTERARWLEASVARRLRARLLAPVPPVPLSALDDIFARPSGLALSAEQMAAVRTAVAGRLVVITGGPGTGKTAVAAAIVRAFAHLDPRPVALAAPTGKAAQRLTEVIAGQLRRIAMPSVPEQALLVHPPVAATLHRLLGVRPGAVAHGTRAYLPVSAVIVDESSMIDLQQMAALLDGVGPDTTIVLLGDAHQLPAVAAGQIMADLTGLAGGAACAHGIVSEHPAALTLIATEAPAEVAASIAPRSEVVSLAAFRAARATAVRGPGGEVAATVAAGEATVDVSSNHAASDAAGTSVAPLAGQPWELPSVIPTESAAPPFDNDAVVAARQLMAQRVATLTHSFRMDAGDPDGARILTAANAIDSGNVKALVVGKQRLAVARERVTELAWRGVEWLDTENAPELVSQAVAAGWKRMLLPGEIGSGGDTALPVLPVLIDAANGLSPEQAAALDAVFAARTQTRILCATRQHGYGATFANAQCHQLWARARRFEAAAWHHGEPVLVNANDYQRGLWNGDQGIVARTRLGKEEMLRVWFRLASDGAYRWQSFALEALADHLSLAWAMTVHKSQGSEMDNVVVLLPERDAPIVTRELLYTAVTRARRSVVLAAPRTVLLAARRGVLRNSRLVQRILAPDGT